MTPPPIEVKRNSWARWVPPTREEFEAAVRWAGDEARRTTWLTLEHLELFIAVQVTRQLKRGAGAVRCGIMNDTGKPKLSVWLANGMCEFLEISADTQILEAGQQVSLASVSLPQSIKALSPRGAGRA